MPSTTQSVALSTGVRLPYVEHGDPAGVPVVQLHGWPDSWRFWERLLACLPASVHALALSQRGYGDADRPQTGYRPEDSVADLAGFLDTVGLERAIVVGHSWGSLTAQRFAVEHPDRTLGTVLIGALRSFDHSDLHELWQVVAELADPIDRGFVREFQQSTLAQPVSDDYFETIVSESLKMPAAVWRATFAEFVDIDRSVELESIAAPTIVFWGDQEIICPREDQDELAARIPGAELVVYEGAGHALHWEEPERFAGDLVGFVEARIR
jgi:pimeloyl-ACP methyl ester carboxylesterase